MKRLISLFLTVVLLATTLSACSLPRFSDKDSTEVVESDGTLTMGQWLMLINNAFGMESYTETEPYFESVATTSPYYEAVQIATEWEIINVNEPLDVNKKLSWEEALVTLVNAGEFIDIESEKQDKINYAIANFDNSISDKILKKEIQYQNAVVLLATAQEKWANITYEKNVEEVKYNEEIVNLVEDVKTNYEKNNNEITISSDLVGEIKEGDIYVIQSKENPLEYTYCKAKEVTTKDGYTHITNSDEKLKLEEVFEELQLEGNIVPTADNTVIYDPYGNIIACPEGFSHVLAKDDPNFSTVGFTQVAETELKVGDYTISYDIDLDDELSFEVGLEKEKNGFSVGSSFAVNELSIVHDVDLGWFKIKKAMLRLDYEVENTFEVGYSKEFDDKEQATLAEIYEVTGVFVSECKRKVLREFDGTNYIEKEEVIKIFSIDVYSIGIAKITLDVNFKIAVDGSVSVIVTQSGALGIEYKKGKIRFIKEYNKDVDAELKAQIECTLGIGPALYALGFDDPIIALEAAIGAGASAAIKMHLVDEANHLIEEYSFDDNCAEDCEALASLQITATPDTLEKVAKLQGGHYNAEAGTSIQLHMGICLDVTVYAILEFGVTDNCYACDWIGDSAELTCRILGEDNAKILNYHVDNWEWNKGKITWYPSEDANYCSLKFKPFDKEEATTEEETTTEEPTASVEPNPTIGDNSYDVDYGEFLLLTDFSATVKVGGKYSVKVEQLPTGYSLSDIIFVSADPSIANVNVGGIVEGKKGGSTTITVTTSDGKHIAAISITVKADEKVDFEGVEI